MNKIIVTGAILVLFVIGFSNSSKSGSTAGNKSPGTGAPGTGTPGTETPPVVAKAKGDRILGMHLSEPQDGFNSGFQTATQIKFDAVNLHFPWGIGSFAGTLPVPVLETNGSANCSTSSTYDMTFLGYARAFYPTYNK
jgi:hypothetical protein